mmetsp:Transcript_20852/g.35709  ORF Transcript_20852/g.35709 Transcript_20852/m.35709 type:complete len:108 (-) Transcript_20852:199-522(-)
MTGDEASPQHSPAAGAPPASAGRARALDARHRSIAVRSGAIATARRSAGGLAWPSEACPARRVRGGCGGTPDGALRLGSTSSADARRRRGVGERVASHAMTSRLSVC